MIAALMRGETVSLNANQTELKRQERFDKMTQALAEIHSKMDALEAARQQDRNALDNVLFGLQAAGTKAYLDGSAAEAA